MINYLELQLKVYLMLMNTKDNNSNNLKHNYPKHQSRLANYLCELCYIRDETHVNE